MPIIVRPDGSIEADSVADAIAISRALRNGSITPEVTVEPPRPRGRPRHAQHLQNTPVESGTPMERFWASLEDDLKAILVLLARSREDVTSKKLAEMIRVKTTQLPPIFKRLRNRAETAGIDSAFIEREWHDGDIGSVYKLLPSFAEQVEEVSKQRKEH